MDSVNETSSNSIMDGGAANGVPNDGTGTFAEINLSARS